MGVTDPVGLGLAVKVDVEVEVVVVIEVRVTEGVGLWVEVKEGVAVQGLTTGLKEAVGVGEAITFGVGEWVGVAVGPAGAGPGAEGVVVLLLQAERIRNGRTSEMNLRYGFVMFFPWACLTSDRFGRNSISRLTS